ncbi:maleylpyruvate isomerase family mycothiol-dependent enzyme [Nocardioides cynanchi]|uniref:maleylpyruvate isomerase family mycothiol-dependent enzyme n=1 Tax=Nocardioides cynanchi TaxID=2558918 RepID=UPI00124766AB|nr:maleylpyruvate isomerase family mycothiol-dependent enzyme [Nocardioides cynanchi]
MSDRERLTGYVDVWWEAITDFTGLLESLAPEDWRRPTDLVGWDVHACAAHTAHLEAVLSGAPEETVRFDPGPHVATLAQAYTEHGVVARQDATPEELISEIRDSATARRTSLLHDPPDDGAAAPPRTPGGIGWTWETLLRNRPLDVWMHEQDVRRAVGRPGGLDGAPARHTVDYLLEGMGMVLGKRAGAAPGSTLVVSVEGSRPAAFGVTETGRGVPLPAPPDAPTVGLSLDRETFVVLAGGRRPPDGLSPTVEGDADLAARILSGMALTP